MFLAVLDEYCGAPAAPAPPRLGGDRASSERAAETADAGVALGGGCDTFTFSPDVVASSVASFFSSSGSGGGGDGAFSFPVASRTFAEGAAVRLWARLLGAMCDFEQNSKNEPIFQF